MSVCVCDEHVSYLYFQCVVMIAGKTSAVIESILQISINNPSLRILACAPSDAAADVTDIDCYLHAILL